MRKSLALLIINVFVLVLAGCAKNYADESKEGKPTMLELHQAHIAGLYGNKVESARSHFESVSDRLDSKRVAYHDDLRLPNPELEMVVFPKRNGDGSVQPEQSVKFSMFRLVHYKVGQR